MPSNTRTRTKTRQTTQRTVTKKIRDRGKRGRKGQASSDSNFSWPSFSRHSNRVPQSVPASGLLSNKPFHLQTIVIAHIQEEEKSSSSRKAFSGFCVGDVDYRPHSKMGFFSYRIVIELPLLEDGEYISQVDLTLRKDEFVADLLHTIQNEQDATHLMSEGIIGSIHLNQHQIDDVLKRRMRICIQTSQGKECSGQIKIYNPAHHDEKYDKVLRHFHFL